MASSIEQALYDYLPTQISGIRLYWVQVPDSGTITRPYVTMDTIASPDLPPYIGERGSVASIQLSVWSDKVDALNLGNSIVDALDQYSGLMGTYDVFQISMGGPISLKDPDFDDLYQMIVEAAINYSRGMA